VYFKVKLKAINLKSHLCMKRKKKLSSTLVCLHGVLKLFSFHIDRLSSILPPSLLVLIFFGINRNSFHDAFPLINGAIN